MNEPCPGAARRCSGMAGRARVVSMRAFSSNTAVGRRSHSVNGSWAFSKRSEAVACSVAARSAVVAALNNRHDAVGPSEWGVASTGAGVATRPALAGPAAWRSAHCQHTNAPANRSRLTTNQIKGCLRIIFHFVPGGWSSTPSAACLALTDLHRAGFHPLLPSRFHLRGGPLNPAAAGCNLPPSDAVGPARLPRAPRRARRFRP
ncbi:MAG: hypothetical protein BWX84_02408 [Verrucomicrobia bacterium ADurb.Bin118]|nr:MAG: hypothetical protein BWX84_02408 [Verrucomicrobia bacterium ADurb.Bin118]